MTVQNIDLPEVLALQQHARFYREGERDFVEISFTGVKDTVIQKVQPEHMARFPEAWAAHCDGTPMKQRTGTPLTDIPGVDQQRAEHYISRNVHNVEELAVLHDGQCQALGHGTLTLRKAAQELLTVRRMKQVEASRSSVMQASAGIGAVPAEKYASESDLTAVKQTMGELASNVASLVAMLQAQAAAQAPKRRGPKPKNEASGE